MKFSSPNDLTPEGFEVLIKEWFESCSGELNSFTSSHREKMQGLDGEYEIDIAMSFKIFDGATISIVVECKKYKNPVGREIVQILNDRKNSVGAHKAFLVSTSNFQSGAIEYASKHGIALIQVVNGVVMYVQANIGLASPIPENADKLAALCWLENENDSIVLPMGFSKQRIFLLDQYLTNN